MDTAESIRIGGDSGPGIDRRNIPESLVLKVVTDAHGDISRMPYKKPPLSDVHVAVLRSWLEQGAPSPADEAPEKNRHWSLLAPARPEPPAVKQPDWPRNPIDSFILARCEANGLAPSAAADRATVFRRLHLDLLGLPPNPADVEAWLADARPDAYERAADRLLASPHYGERWGRVWLDVARYADSNGYSIDGPRQIWKYRDWVVAALNRDLPYDQFVIEQLAGDLLPEPSHDQRVATGFNRNTQLNQEGGIDREQFRVEAVMDRVNTFGTAFLGLTIACAQCHDHKFDPIAQKDYYQLFAFFNNTVDEGRGQLEFPEELEPMENHQQELEHSREEFTAFLDDRAASVVSWQRTLNPAARAALSPAVLATLDLPWTEYSFDLKRTVYAAAAPDDKEFTTRQTRYDKLGARERKPISTLVMQELAKPRETVIFTAGDFTRRGAKVSPGTPASLPPLAAAHPTRLDLARWLFDPENPLPARVFVNRVWQQYFGVGLVETENDFGTQGSLPSNPALLDWLATELVAQKWSLKALHRLIVTSSTYRQSSRTRPDLHVVDPLNTFVARQTRLRLDAEIVRDVALSLSGQLVPPIGGPPVYPPQPEGVMALGQTNRRWNVSTGNNRHRRALYTALLRSTPHPALAVFDQPDAFSTCTRRTRSNTPLQALTLLNDRQFHEFALALGERLQREAQGRPDQGIDFAFRLCLARAPSKSEHARMKELYRQQIAGTPGDARARESVAWTIVARVFLNLDETITRE